MQEWLLAQNGIVIYGALFLLLLGGVIGLPIPEDFPLIFGGILIQIGKGQALLIFLVCYTPVVLGDLFIFSVGRYFGPKIFKQRWFDSPKTRARIKRIRIELERRGVLMIFIARHLFYLRTFTFLSCGALKMRFSRFLVTDMIAALISVPLMLTIGYFLANSYDQAKKLLDEASLISLVVLLIAGSAYFIYRKYRQESSPQAADGVEEALLPLDEDHLKP